jgi:glucoamylase
LQHITFIPLEGKLSDYKLFWLVTPHLMNGGAGNNGWVGEYKGEPLLFARKDLISMAAGASCPLKKMTAGYAGVSDGWKELKQNNDLLTTYREAPDGNIALAAEIDLMACKGTFTIAIGFGGRPEEAALQVRLSLMRGFSAALEDYLDLWRRAHSPCIDLARADPEAGSLFKISTSVLKVHQGKKISGALIASLSIPWGNYRGDNEFGGYHLIWPRDQVETAEAFLAVNDVESALNILVFLMATQEGDGHWPQNMWEDGVAYWSKIQLDETALPIMLAGYLRERKALKNLNPFPMVEKAASFLIRNGPITEQDRWEEIQGFTPYTLSVAIGALLAAADFFDEAGKKEQAAYLRDTADWWNDSIERWLFVENTALAKKLGIPGYYIRANPSVLVEKDPKELSVRIANRPESEAMHPADAIISCDALALVRMGLRDANDPRILSTVIAIDSLLKTETSRGPVWHRYNEDGYGEKVDGAPFDGTGKGRGWPLLIGERVMYELQAGHADEALRLLRVMTAMAGVGGMFPEQIWDDKDIPEHRLYKGHSTGSAKPLVWAHAEYLRALRSVYEGVPFSRPRCTKERYIDKKTVSKRVYWHYKCRIEQMPAHRELRIQVPESAKVRWTADNWQTFEDLETAPTGFGDHYLDLTPLKGIMEFTLFWKEKEIWEGNNYKIEIN